MTHRAGRVELICGSMFSGKTEELIRRVRRARIAKQVVQVFKPAIDNRYSVTRVVSHNGQDDEAHCVSDSRDLEAAIDPTATTIAIDEAQFFDPGIVEVVERLAGRGMRVILAGLDQDFRAVPFGPMPQLMALAEDVLKLHAICVVCGEDASRTQRLVDGLPAHFDDPIILVGASERYEARCRLCHQVPTGSR